MNAGIFVVEITPPVGVELCGAPFGPSRGVLHPLFGRALALEQDGERLLLFACDLIGFDWDYASAIRREISRTTGVPFDAIMLACTHTHGGPATATYRNWGKPDLAYRRKLHELLVDAAGQALKTLRPARIGAAMTDCPGVAVNRRFGADGPVDDRLAVVRVDGEDGEPLAISLNYACHPVNLHNAGEFTPDFPHYIERHVRKALGREVPVLFLQGAGGDLNPSNFLWHTPDETKAAETGRTIAGKALEILPEIKTNSVALAFALRDVEIPLQPLPAKDELLRLIEESERALAKLPAGDDYGSRKSIAGAKTNRDWAREALAAYESGKQKTSATVTLQGFRVGDVALVGVPGELFCEFGQRIGQEFVVPPSGGEARIPPEGGPTNPHALTVTLANGCLGYFPSRAAFEQGFYEAVRSPRYVGLHTFDPSVGERICEGALGLLRDLGNMERNRQSRALWGRSCNVIVGGGQAHKRPVALMYRGGPSFAVRAKGARFWDADGNEYLDYLLGYGPIVIGHADADVNAAVREQMEEGAIFSIEHPSAIALAEELCRLIPCAEMVAYFVGGTSATAGAVRCARAHTGREKIIRCGYHGWFDWCWPDIPGVPRFHHDLVLTTPYNDLNALEQLFRQHPGQIAGVIIEAVQKDGPTPEFFPGVRRLCDEHGAVFILDEVKTGFRFDLGGAQVPFRIDADLAVFGKALCNGYPGSVVVGKRRVMEARADTYMAATFHADALSIAAAQTVLRVMRERDGITHFHRLGRRLMDGLNEVFRETRYPFRIGGFPPMPAPMETTEDDPVNPIPAEFKGKVVWEWCAAMQRRGVYVTRHVWFLSLAHTPEDIEHTIAIGADAAKDALERLKSTTRTS